MMGLRNFSFSMAAAVSLKPGPKHMIVNWLYVLGLDLGYSSCLVVWSLWSLDWSLDGMDLLFVVHVTVTEVSVCELIFG